MLPGMNGCSTVATARSCPPAPAARSPSAPGRSCAAPMAPAGRCSHWPRGPPSRPLPAPRGTPAGPTARAPDRQRGGGAQQLGVLFGRRSPARQPAVAVARHQRQRALRQIAQVVRQLDVDARNDRLVAHAAIGAERLLAQQEVAHLVEAEGRDQLPRLDDVAERLAHLLALDDPPAVGGDPLRQRQPGRHQEGRPVDRVEADDVLADEMHVGRPERPARRGLVREAAGGDVVVQRVQPDIHHVAGRVRHRDAPAEAGAADRQVVQPAAHEADDLVAARRWAR